MPDLTPNLGLKKPLANETVSRASYNENLNLMDQNAARAGDVSSHLADYAQFKKNMNIRRIMEAE